MAKLCRKIPLSCNRSWSPSKGCLFYRWPFLQVRTFGLSPCAARYIHTLGWRSTEVVLTTFIGEVRTTDWTHNVKTPSWSCQHASQRCNVVATLWTLLVEPMSLHAKTGGRYSHVLNRWELLSSAYRCESRQRLKWLWMEWCLQIRSTSAEHRDSFVQMLERKTIRTVQ